MFRPSANVVTFSNRPSPSVSSRTLDRVLPRPIRRRGVRIFDRVGQPDPPPLIKRHVQRLLNLRLGGDEVDLEPRRQLEQLLLVGRREPRRRADASGERVFLGDDGRKAQQAENNIDGSEWAAVHGAAEQRERGFSAKGATDVLGTQYSVQSTEYQGFPGSHAVGHRRHWPQLPPAFNPPFPCNVSPSARCTTNSRATTKSECGSSRGRRWSSRAKTLSAGRFAPTPTAGIRRKSRMAIRKPGRSGSKGPSRATRWPSRFARSSR